MDIDATLRQYKEAEKAIRENEIIQEQTAKSVLNHLMSGIVPYYGRKFDWESRRNEPLRCLIHSSHADLFYLILHCEEVAENQGYAQIVTIEEIKSENGTELIRITTEAPYGTGESDIKSVDVPKRFFLMTPEEIHEMIATAIAVGKAERAEQERKEAKERQRRRQQG